MRYVILFVAILAACTVPPNVQKTEAVPINIVVPVDVEVLLPKEHKEPDPKAQKPAAKTKTPNAPPCAGIDTGDVKESINLKLDCLLKTK